MARSGFTKKRVGTMTLGEKLKHLREDRRITILEASRGTKIQVRYLEFLEAGDYDSLPADVYVRGFLRSYGDFLGVDEHVLVKLYEKEKGIRENMAKSRNPDRNSQFVNPVNISSFVFTPKKLAVVLLCLVVISTIFYLYREVGSFSSDPRLIIFSPSDNSEISGNSVVIDGVTDKDSKLFINGQPILVDDDGRFREEITLQSGVNTISVHSENKFGKEKTETISVQGKREEPSEENGSSQSSGDFQFSSSGSSSSENGKLQLELRVDPGPVWMNVEADGKLVFSGTMLAGAVQSFSADEKIIVNSGRGNATFVKLNGKDMGALSQDPGVVKDALFDKNTK